MLFMLMVNMRIIKALVLLLIVLNINIYGNMIIVGICMQQRRAGISGGTPVILVHFRSTGEPQYYGYYSVATVGYVNVGISWLQKYF